MDLFRETHWTAVEVFLYCKWLRSWEYSFMHFLQMLSWTAWRPSRKRSLRRWSDGQQRRLKGPDRSWNRDLVNQLWTIRWTRMDRVHNKTPVMGIWRMSKLLQMVRDLFMPLLVVFTWFCGFLMSVLIASASF